jgi:spore coat polysaccharide biosynthesis protein SpsF
MSIGVVLQARMGSTRLPGKTLRRILGRPMVYYAIERLKCIEVVDVVILAVPDTAEDLALREIAGEMEIEFFAGSEDDVLDRYYRAAACFDLDHIYRATGDNPLIEAAVQDQLIRYHIAGEYEYTENFRCLPHGLGGEVFSRGGLQRCWELSEQAHQCEGVNDYILEQPSEFRVGNPQNNPYPQEAQDLQWTVDTLEQFEWVRSAYEALHRPGHTITVQEVLDFSARRIEAECPAI